MEEMVMSDLGDPCARFALRGTKIPGCFEITPRRFEDARGRFVKIFNDPDFRALGLETRFVEGFFSVSRRGTVRGMHFQAPPADHEKIVYCPAGRIFDVVLDLRVGSPAYSASETFNLAGDPFSMVYIPKGCAHGFCALEDDSVVTYLTSTVHAPELDRGIHWRSVGASWPFEEYIVSGRDEAFPPLAEYPSPFKYG